jgi:aspartyl-tRNA(Asn)/glutamyl-tRNA(Gln) amidotransferase subunit C
MLMAELKKIDRKTVEHICEVAKLELDEKEIDKYMKDLDGILEVFKQIDEVDTSSVEPAFHPYKAENVWREDKVEKKEEGWDPFSNTKLKEKGYFKGPKIV